MHRAIRIVIADDNTDLTEIMSEYLSGKEGIEIVGTAANGLDAIKIIEATRPDIVLLDEVMPQLDGLGVLEKINTDHFSNKTKFIMLSAIGQYKAVQLALSLGAEFYIIKPFGLEDLVSRIRQFQHFDEYIMKSAAPCEKAPFEDEFLMLKIKNMLDRIGVPSHLKGYRYLIYSIKTVVEDLTAINSVTKLIYAQTANKYKTTQTRVERAIRNAIELTWSRGNLEIIYDLFDNNIGYRKTRPSNSEFIVTVANHLWDRASAG